MAAPTSIEVAFNDLYGASSQDKNGTPNIYTPADIAVDLARGHFVHGSLSGINTILTMKAANPDLFAGVYVIGHAQDPATGPSLYGMQLIRTSAMWTALQTHPEAFLYTSTTRTSGNRVSWTMSDGNVLYKLDPGALYTKQLIRNHWIHVYNTYNYVDFTFQDNIGEKKNIGGSCYPGASTVTWAGKGGSDIPYTDAGWIENEHALLSYVKSGVEAAIGREHVQWGNMLWHPTETDYQAFAGSLAGFMCEAVAGYTNSGNFNSPSLVTAYIEAIKAWIATAGKAALLLHQVPTNATLAQELYGFGAMMQALPLSAQRSVVQAGKTINKISMQNTTATAYARWRMRAFAPAYNPYGLITATSTKDVNNVWTIETSNYRIKTNPNNSTSDGVAARTTVITEITPPPPPPPPPPDPPPVAGAPQIVASAAGTVGDGTGITSWTVPGTAVAGQRALVFVYYRNLPSAATLISEDDAFTVIQDLTATLAQIDQSGNGGMRVYDRVLSQDDIGATFRWNSQVLGDIRSGGVVLSGADPTSTYTDITIDTNTSLSSIGLPAATSGAQTNILILRSWMLSTGYDQPDQVPASPTLPVLDMPGTPTVAINAAVYQQTREAAGTVDALTVTITPAMTGTAPRYFGMTIVVTPVLPPAWNGPFVVSATQGTPGDATGLTAWTVPADTSLPGDEAIVFIDYRNTPATANPINTQALFQPLYKPDGTVAMLDQSGNGGIRTYRFTLRAVDIGATFNWDMQALVDCRSLGIVVRKVDPITPAIDVTTDTALTTASINLPAANSGVRTDTLTLRTWSLSTGNDQPNQAPPAGLEPLLDIPGTSTLAINAAAYYRQQATAGAIAADTITISPAMGSSARFFALSVVLQVPQPVIPPPPSPVIVVRAPGLASVYIRHKSSAGTVKNIITGTGRNDPESDANNGYLWLAWTLKRNDVHVCEFALPYDPALIASFADKDQIEIVREYKGIGLPEYTVLNAIFRDDAIEADDYGQLRYIARAYGPMHLLSWRHIAYPAEVAGKTVITDAGENVVKSIVNYNAGPLASTANGRDRTPNPIQLSIETALGRGPSYTLVAGQRENLLDVVQRIAGAAIGGDVDVVQVGAAYEFRYYPGQRGSDKRSTIKFSMDRANMRNPRLRRDRSAERTVALAAGQGRQDERLIIPGGVTGPNYSATHDIEFLVNANNVSTVGGLQARALAELDARKYRNVLTYDIIQTDEYAIDRDYVLGDIVEASFAGVTVAQIIDQVQFVYGSGEGERITIRVQDV